MTIELDGNAVLDREALHDTFGAVLPEWYGRNLDALYDCLTDLPSAEIRVSDPAALVRNLGEYGEKCLQTLRDAAADNPGLEVWIEGEDD